MIPVLLSALFVLAGVVTLLPDVFAEFLRDYGVTILAGLVLVGIVAGHLLAEIEACGSESAAQTSEGVTL